MSQWKEYKLEENINYIKFINSSLFCYPSQIGICSFYTKDLFIANFEVSSAKGYSPGSYFLNYLYLKRKEQITRWGFYWNISIYTNMYTYI